MVERWRPVQTVQYLPTSINKTFFSAMDENLSKRCCPNCSQPYRLKSLSPGQKENYPLFLRCGHGICENCIRNIIKFLEPIECKICHQDMELDTSNIEDVVKDSSKFYELFPINLPMFGELALQLFQNSEKTTQKVENVHFIDLQSLLQNDDMQGKCLECESLTTTQCKQCATTLCDNCFYKTHKNFVIFKTHALETIEPKIDLNNCKTHKGKPLDYYCKDCCKTVCMDCMIVGGENSCQKHTLVTMEEMNESFIDEIGAITPKVSETFKRLTKTAVDIGTLLYNIDNDTGTKSDLTKNIMDIEQHFSKLFAAICKHKHEIIKIIVNLKCAEQQSLKDAKKYIVDHIKEANQIMKTIEAYSDPSKFKQINLSLLLEKAKAAADAPWYLKKEDNNKDPLKIVVNEDICNLVSSYIQLTGDANCAYKLYSPSELGDIELPPPPVAPVYPPEFPKDVRQINKPKKVIEVKKEREKPPGFLKSAPKYRTKSASISSLNSTESDTSTKSYLTSNDGNLKPKVHPVMPFRESEHPRPVNEGSQELIYISHIVDPHNFYVQRACHQGIVKEMLREFKNAATLPKPSANHATEGKIYLAFIKADNMWQRCRVIRVDKRDPNNPMFHVFCIDFGSTEFLPIDKLRLLPPARVQSPYPLAMHCSLANCVPKHGSWTQEDTLLVHNIINNKQAVIHVRRVRSTSNYSTTLEVDLVTFEDCVDVAHALVFHERAKMPNPNLKCPILPGTAEKPTIFMNHNDFKYKSVEEVYITHTQSPDKFFVRKRHFHDTFTQLCEDLEEEYGGVHGNVDNVYLPEVGMVCIVNVEKVKWVGEGVAWLRAMVSQLMGKAAVRVAFVDIGGEAVVHWTALRRIRRKYTTFKALATECYLAGITPLNKKWSSASVTLLHKYERKLLELHVENTRNPNSLGVVLYYLPDDADKICINNEMITHKFAVAFGMHKFFVDNNMQAPAIKNKSVNEPKQEKIILKKQSPKVIKEKDLEAKDKGPLRLEAKVINYQSPSLIYITLVHQRKGFIELFEKIQKHYSSKAKEAKEDIKNHEWAVGDRCCTFCNQSQTWRRATILQLEGDNAKVFYTDFAITETVPVASLRELTEEFASVGDAAFKCHLSSVVPAVGEEWPSLTKEYLKELLDVYKRVFITKVGNFKDKSMPVEMWVYHTTPGGALEPDKSEWRCLNKKIIEQGLGVPDKGQEVKSNTSEAGSAADDDTLSFLNVTGCVRDWLQLEPVPTVAQKAAAEDSEEASTNVMYITDWLPPEPFASKEFSGMPTNIDYDGIIYLHDVTQQETLEVIRKALEVRFKQPDPKAKFVTWAEGEPCIALFYLDNRFYRGRVMAVNDDDKTCLIRYVDYGNEDTCTFENLRKSIVLHQIPVQAHRCVLDRIEPVAGKWDRDTLDYIHKSIVEKQCYVTITGDPVDDVTPIELKYDKLNLNDHLVEFELAKFRDGSKAVVHKFAGATVDEKPNDSDSDIDYIIEDEDTAASEQSFDIQAIKGRDWNTLLDTDDSTSIDSKYITVVNFNEKEFTCNIFVINDVNSLELSVIFEDDTKKLYEDMFTEIQIEGPNMPPLNGIMENKACVAMFHEDQQWYRACILQYSEAKGQVKVRYIDYGNIGIIQLTDAREISEEWAALPPATVTAKLCGVRLNTAIDVSTLSKEYTDTFLDKGPFHAKVVNEKESIPYVELKNDKGELVYQGLIDKDIYVRSDGDG